MPPKAPPMGREFAEALGFRAVALIVADENLLPRFLAASGCGAEDLRQRIADPYFLGAVLDFVLEDDSTIHLLAESAGVGPETIMLARAKLPGAQMDWNP